MKPAWLAKVPPAWRARLMRLGFNLLPAFRGTGGRVEHIAQDFSHIRIRLPLSWRTRNVVGSIYGGSLFAVTDGVHPVMIMSALGDGVIVWDKAASIPLPQARPVDAVRRFRPRSRRDRRRSGRPQENPELDRTYRVELKDADGLVPRWSSVPFGIADKTITGKIHPRRRHMITSPSVRAQPWPRR